MAIVQGLISDGQAKQAILDIPAGNGHFAQALEQGGHEITRADINGRDGYVFADMNKDLPFETDRFDAAICLEGIEHLIDPVKLLGELIRVTRPGGRVYITTPNISNFYSRLQFLFTGTFFQFNPVRIRNHPPDSMEDRFHISPMPYQRIRYLANYFDADIEIIRGDKTKRKTLMPLYLLIQFLGWPWRRKLFSIGFARKHPERSREIRVHMNSRAALYARSLIVVIRKRGA